MMSKKLAIPYALMTVFAVSLAFTAGCKDKGDHSQMMHDQKMEDMHHMTQETGKTEAGAGASEAVMREVTKEEVGKTAVCPVTGEKFTVSKKTLSAEYKGKNYYFCCYGCKGPFLKDPEKYTQEK